MRFTVITLLFFSSVFSKDFSLDIEQMIELSLKNNSLNKISKLKLEIANAQYEQALSANYPTLDAVLYANRNNKDTVFQQRGNFKLSSEMTKTLALANTLNLPSGAIRQGAQAQISNTPTSYFPEGKLSADIDTIASGRDTVRGELKLNYPLFTGGKISSIIEQARLNKHLAQTSIVRSENSVVYDVKKYYYAYVLTNELESLVNSIYQNMKISTDLAKDYLEKGSKLEVNKSDYLNTKLTTALLSSAKSKIKLNKQMLNNAIANLIGLKAEDNLEILYKERELLEQNKSLQDLILKFNEQSPDLKNINFALKIKSQQVKEARADYYPQVGIFANASHSYNSYEYGYLNKDDEDRWNIGLVMKVPLFDGFKTKNKVLEKKLERKVVQEQKVLLEEGLTLSLKNEFIKSKIGYEQVQELKEAIKTARENSEINFKGFQYELVEPKELIQSQLLEVYVKTDYLKSLHDYLVSLATIDKLVGMSLEKF